MTFFRFPSIVTKILHRIPGLTLVLILAAVAGWMARQFFFSHLGLSAAVLAIIGGMILGNTIYPSLERFCRHGVTFSKTRLLRFSIILYGFRLTFQDIITVGPSAVLIDTLILSSTFALALWAGCRLLKLDRQSSILIGAGSAVCGAAAVLSTEPIVKASTEKIAVAFATVVVFGTVGMFLYPMLFSMVRSLGVSEFSFGIFTGSTVHEVAQVVAAGQAISTTAATSAIITKMIRVMMLAPFLLLLSAWLAHRSCGEKRPIIIPWFAIAFLGVAAFNSLHLLPQTIVNQMILLDDLMLAMSMGALGLTTHISSVRQAGTRPLVLAAILFTWLLVGGSLINVIVLGLLS